MSSPWSLDARNGRAVEVVTVLGDTVLGAKHCTDPRGGKLKPATWAVLGFGAACLLGVAIAFALSLADAAADRAWLDAHRLANWPAYAFRPTTRGLGVDLGILGGLYAGIASLAIGLVRLPRERTRPGFRVGSAPGVDQPVASAPSADFPLVAPFGDDFVLNLGPGIECTWIEDGVETPLADASELPIPTRGRIRARCGNATFLVAAVVRPRAESLPRWRIEWRPFAYVLASLAVHIWVFYVPPLEERTIEVCPVGDAGAITPIVDSEIELDRGAYDCPHLVAMGYVVECVERAWAEHDEELRYRASEDMEARLRRYLTPPHRYQQIIAREEALEMARYVLREESFEAEPPPPRPLLSIGLPSVQGGYERWLLRRHVKHQFNELAYCYENALIAKPWLEGAASVQFLIATDGTVLASQGAGMDAGVARCLAAVIERIRFPLPSDGGRSLVNYPFHFHAVGR